MKPYNIRIEYGKTKPSQLCILESAAPLFSWACAAGDGETQAAFSLRVLHDGEAVWQTGWHASQEQSRRARPNAAASVPAAWTGTPNGSSPTARPATP